MSSQKVGSIKVPPFKRENYSMWKMKMILFMKASNPSYMDILAEEPLVPMKTVIDETIGVEKTIPKTRADMSVKEKELDGLDTNLYLIIVDSLDDEMSHQVMSCKSAKHMWDTIGMIMEGTEEVRENRLDILTSLYEAFKSLPGESVTQVFERFNRLINELSIQGKTYPLRETNRKFRLTLLAHLEHKVSSIKERDNFNTLSL